MEHEEGEGGTEGVGGGVGGVEEEEERTALVSLRGMSWATLEVFGVGNAALGMVHKATELQADWTRSQIPRKPSGTNIALRRRTHRQGVSELACSSVSSGDATRSQLGHQELSAGTK